MNLTKQMLDVAFSAWVASREGEGVVLLDDAYPAADELAEHGWLERRFEPGGELSWHWTTQADVALGLGELMLSAEGREN